jgi:hypothetical protein
MDAMHGNRGVVLQFRGAHRPPAPMPRRVGSRTSGSPAPDGDEKLNAEWDLLIRVASHAWSWRDPESLDTLEHAVSRLRSWIAHDWSA